MKIKFSIFFLLFFLSFNINAEQKKIETIIPLLTKLNSKTPLKTLTERVLEMSKASNYECVGLYVEGELVGISGLWYSTRHYIGKSAEPDHVVIDEIEIILWRAVILALINRFEIDRVLLDRQVDHHDVVDDLGNHLGFKVHIL